MQTHTSDRQTIKLALILMFLSLLVIYILLFAIKGDVLKPQTSIPSVVYQEPSISETITTQPEYNTNEVTQPTPADSFSTGSGETRPSPTNIDPLNEIEVLSAEIEEKLSSTNGLDKTDDIFILSGTSRYFGPIKSIEILGIDYDYALKDNKNIYYIPLTDQQASLQDSIRKLSGNTFKISTEQELLSNNLFGDSVTYINIPELKNKTVLMIIEIDEKERLVEVEYTLYYQSKNHLKSVFGWTQ